MSQQEVSGTEAPPLSGHKRREEYVIAICLFLVQKLDGSF